MTNPALVPNELQSLCWGKNITWLEEMKGTGQYTCMKIIVKPLLSVEKPLISVMELMVRLKKLIQFQIGGNSLLVSQSYRYVYKKSYRFHSSKKRYWLSFLFHIRQFSAILTNRKSVAG